MELQFSIEEIPKILFPEGIKREFKMAFFQIEKYPKKQNKMTTFLNGLSTKFK